jgi:alkanesulfonate monooxygenase SsuD/methylene tetrahydromethanopterin reductase-like flavin-dependent oxidoreductase (luciferase family)
VCLAQRIATLQHLSEERLVLGLGIGWVEQEYDAVGSPSRNAAPGSPGDSNCSTDSSTAAK